MTLALAAGVRPDQVPEMRRNMTHRQYLVWMQHLENEFNRPSRSDRYVARVSYWLARLYHARFTPNEPLPEPEDFILSFLFGEDAERHRQEEEAAHRKNMAMASKARSMAALGIKPKP